MNRYICKIELLINLINIKYKSVWSIIKSELNNSFITLLESSKTFLLKLNVKLKNNPYINVIKIILI